MTRKRPPQRKPVWTDRALADLEAIGDYIDDGRSYEPPETGSEVPLRLWAGHQDPTHIVFFSKDVLLRRWLEAGLWLPSSWLVLERIGFPEPAYFEASRRTLLLCARAHLLRR